MAMTRFWSGFTILSGKTPHHSFYMNITTLLLRFLQQRRVASALTVLSVAIGVALTAAILTLRLETERAFSQKDTGFEIIIGAKGSPLQLVLNTMYHIGAPVGNFPLADCERLRADKRVKSSLPMVFGDNVGGFKVIGTTPEFFTKFEYRKGLQIGIAEGKPFTKDFEAALGSEAAQNLRLRVGDSVTVRHGLETNEQGAHDHGRMPVVAVLAATGTAIDKGVYMTMHTVWDTHYDEYQESQAAAEQALAKAEGGKSPSANDEHNNAHHTEEQEHAIPPEFTTITALAVKLKSPVFYDSFMRSVNEGTSAQAAIPIREIMGLFQIVGNINGILLCLSYFVIIVGAISIVVAMYTSLNERRREIAILRSLGAHRRSVVGLMLAEAVIIGFVGSVLGIACSRLGLSLAKSFLQEQLGTKFTLAWWYSFDAPLLFGVVVLTALVALIPAMSAYRTDVAENLAPIT